ncbi:MAG: DUF4143 domain-containing protein [Nitrospiria bacterium]
MFLAQNLLAARTGQLFSYSEVSRDLGVAVNTVKRYVRFLEISYQIFLLRGIGVCLKGLIHCDTMYLMYFWRRFFYDYCDKDPSAPSGIA